MACDSLAWGIELGIVVVRSRAFVEKVCAGMVWEDACTRSLEISRIEVIWMDKEHSIVDYVLIPCLRRQSTGKSTGEEYFDRL